MYHSRMTYQQFNVLFLSPMQVHPVYVFSRTHPEFHLVLYLGLILNTPGPSFPIGAYFDAAEGPEQVDVISSSGIVGARRHRRR